MTNLGHLKRRKVNPDRRNAFKCRSVEKQDKKQLGLVDVRDAIQRSLLTLAEQLINYFYLMLQIFVKDVLMQSVRL